MEQQNGEEQEEDNQDIKLASEPGEEIPVDPPGVRFRVRTLFAYMGPGWLMSLAYLDPGNLESDLQNGAYAGYSLIWVLALSTLAGFALQVLAARLGAVTGRHLAETCRSQYRYSVSITLWLCTELAIIGADVQEVIGSAIAFQELFGWPLWLGSFITGVDTFTFLMIDRCGKRLLELLIFVLIMIIMLCFFLNTFMEPPPVQDVIDGFIPQCPAYAVLQLVGTVGAVIMPHNIYLHSGLVSSRAIDRTDSVIVRQANKYFAIDSLIALFISFLINLSLVTTFASFFSVQICGEAPGGPFACYPSSSPDETIACNTAQGTSGSCQEIGLETAGGALQAVFRGNGKLARTVFAIGVLAAGQASTMTGTFAGQLVMEGFLQWKIPIWKRTVITRALSLGPAMLIALLTSSSPNLNNRINEWINVLQSVQLPFALLPVLSFTCDVEIMGKDFALGYCSQIICWGLALVIISLNVYLVCAEFAGSSTFVWIMVGVFFVAYMLFISILVAKDVARMGCAFASLFSSKPKQADSNTRAPPIRFGAIKNQSMGDATLEDQHFANVYHSDEVDDDHPELLLHEM